MCTVVYFAAEHMPYDKSEPYLDPYGTSSVKFIVDLYFSQA